MQLFIPEIGTKLALEENWSFKLYLEFRNRVLYRCAGFQYSYDGGQTNAQDKDYICRGWRKEGSQWVKEVTLPAGAILTVDRFYVRKGAGDFSSVSFFLDKKSLDKEFSPFIRALATHKGAIRFWAKLADVNTIIFK